ncbi:prephenate dehydratase [Candidatus Enterococcus ferrettii]|uniref:Prephenate dehydratase n=1 Tax=Candidatus Enterococcus ferrettii TaxID=2815324 RepID=A0ABV0ERN7_9ENTE|nr:prephenate dehydratase [Enterococcus sp. 665A]MBO1338942.1 prephenate dehydratase [Enterococcus sp. 665A]
MDIGYLGPKGSFTHSAACSYFSNGNFISYSSLVQLIDARMNKQIDYAMVPVENTIEGSVLPTIDGVYQTLPTIQGELVLPIAQQLMVHKDHQNQWQNATLICSHPQALAQSQVFIRDRIPNAEIEQMASTTLGAKKVADHPKEIYAAIGPKMAAKEYDLVIVEEDIQSVANNETRFWLLGDEPIDTELLFAEQKATLIVDLPMDRPGALYHLLEIFAKAKINLTKIESRPQKTRLGDYFFIIDLEVPENSTVLDNALAQLDGQNFPFNLIGNYPTYRKP